MAAHLGAHETVEAHEILTSTINAINTMQLYRPFAKDPRLAQMMDKQMQFAITEYNHAVQTLQNLNGQRQMTSPSAAYRGDQNFTPVYGLDNPAVQSPNMSTAQMDDRDVASCLLGLHKASATMKIIAALECANPQLRAMMQQGAMNCSEQAYEVWQYMNQSGYYQVPTMKEMTTNTVLSGYETANPTATGFYQNQPMTRTQ
ncbi:spore coat protein [Paenibacillus harenae]|uniref:spore coat protein n=1 Tax=Paenibacillus harenae TaxID=306543 RepID=UPI002790CBE2|nr:spore coat protein [Paenibacillus harenae]MDQ0061401.1 spore coat protein CotF [Paenibacillus harenae]